MAHKSKSSRRLRTKLKPLYAAMLPLMVLGMSHQAIAAVVADGNENLTVSGTITPALPYNGQED